MYLCFYVYSIIFWFILFCSITWWYVYTYIYMYILYLNYFLLRLLIGLCKDMFFISVLPDVTMFQVWNINALLYEWAKFRVPLLEPIMCHRDTGLPWVRGEGVAVIPRIFPEKLGICWQVLVNGIFQCEYCPKISTFF